MRRLTGWIATLIVAALLMPSGGAEASARVISVSFEGDITLWSSFICFNQTSLPSGCVERELWAPVAPAAECGTVPDCPSPPLHLVNWGLDDGLGTPGRTLTCTAVTDSGTASACTILGTGSMHVTLGTPGPHCYSAFQGSANFTVTINGTETYEIGGPAAGVHHWPTLQWPLTEGTDLPIDGGVGEMRIVEPRANCGLDGPDFHPMTEASVEGQLVWSLVE